MILPYFSIKKHPIYIFYDNIEEVVFYKNHGDKILGMAND